MSTAVALSLRGLRKAYGKVVALDEFNLEVAVGECVVLIGHNGSGKTTATRIAAGQLKPTAGQAIVLGSDIHQGRDTHRARAQLAFVPDSPVLYPDLTVAEHLQLVGLAHGVTDDLDDRGDALLREFDLTARRDFLPFHLSRGMRQKTQLACSLVRPFKVLILDEPIVGLDPPSQATLRTTLLNVKRAGAAVLLTTHQLGFAAGLADRAVVLSEGRVVDEGSYERVMGGTVATALGLV
jgi:ABC-2 type transport system ATP-binding protein